MQCRDVYAYARALLDVLFTKEEQRSSIVLESKKSTKPALDKNRVKLLFGKHNCNTVISIFHKIVLKKSMEKNINIFNYFKP